MSLIKNNNGLAPVRTLLSEFFDTDRFFRDFGFNTQWVPAANVIDNEKDYTIELSAPGLKKEDFKVNVENGILNISAETKSEKEEKKNNYTRREFSYESFNRSFTLPENASDEKIDAKYENGLLKLTLAKKVPSSPKRKDIAIA